MRANHQSVRTRKGFVSVYMAFSSLLLIPMVGLAIDFSVLYSVRARLQTAVDAAAIGSGTTLNRGAVMDTVAVTDAAQRFFDANYPTGYWGSSPVFPVSITPLQGLLGVRTITVNAKEYVPMLFLRVVGVNQSTVAATAQVTVRFVNMILVVDRSGSVGRATFNGVATTTIVTKDLHDFVDPSDGSPSPYFSDGRDNIGMVTFGTSWELDFPMSLNFQTKSPTHIGTTIDHIDWANNATNTGDGLFHAYRQLINLAQPGALNVIVMLTDGRPSAFSGTFPLTAGSGPCTDRTDKVGVLSAPVSQGWLPPVGGSTIGVYKSTWSGTGADGTVVVNNSNCAFSGSTVLGNPGNVSQDFPTFPNSVRPPDDNAANLGPFLTTQATNADLPGFTGAGNNTNSARAIRYASFNVADNIATVIRKDTFLNPVIFVIGLNNNNGEEALDADWLARVANDKDYIDAGGHHVFQASQTQGQYFDVNAGGIGAALQQIASEILRLSR
jgi:Flp pilus assembly protein TadG